MARKAAIVAGASAAKSLASGQPFLKLHQPKPAIASETQPHLSGKAWRGASASRRSVWYGEMVAEEASEIMAA